MENTYEKITALVPEGEHFDASAVNEGVYLTEGHVANIEVELKNNADAIAKHDEKVKGLNDQLTAQSSQLTANSSQLEAKDTEIAQLKADLAAEKAKPAASFTQTSKEKDEHGGGEVKELDPVTKEANEKRKLMGLAEVK